MHAIFFSIKRVHLRTLGVVKALLRGFDLTPARFDLMRVVFIHEGGMPQWRLRALLGVSGATVSRMLKALEASGLITREPSPHDKRDLIIRITEQGRTRTDAALSALVDSLIAERMAIRGADFDPELGKQKLEVLEHLLSGMRGAYGDEARFVHPWSRSELDLHARSFRPATAARPDDTRFTEAPAPAPRR